MRLVGTYLSQHLHIALEDEMSARHWLPAPPPPPQVRNFKTAGTSISLTLGQKELPMYCT